MITNVLTTPQEVITEITSFFPEATSRSHVLNGNRFLLELTLPGIAEPIRVTHMVNVITWRSVLEDFQSDTNLGLPPQPEYLSMARSSLAVPLIWQAYQRKKFEERNGDCITLLLQFLYDQDGAEAELQQLGLAPAQLRDRHSLDDLEYFKRLVLQINQLPAADMSRIAARFEHHYPNVFEAARTEAVRRVNQNGFQQLADKIKERVLGQDRAADQIAAALFSQQQSNSTATYLFVGPTGVGKTEMAKTIAKLKNTELLDCWMNQYQSEINASIFFGSPAGYLGSADLPQFAKRVETYHPIPRGREGNIECYTVQNVVVLFDEMEKAHANLKQSFLTILDEKFLLVQYTHYPSPNAVGVNVSKKYYFEKCLFICTSNLFQKEILEGFANPQIIEEFKRLNEQQPTPLTFSPEFLGKVAIIPFGPIPRGQVYQSLLRYKLTPLLKTLEEQLKCESIKIRDEVNFFETLERKFYGNGTDIRKIETIFNTTIKTKIMSSMNAWDRTDLTALTFYIHDAERMIIGIEIETIFLASKRRSVDPILF